MVVVQALQEMRKLRTEKTAEVKEFRLRLEHLKTHKDHSTKLKGDIAEGQEKNRNYMTQINQFEQEVQVTLACQPIHLCSIDRTLVTSIPSASLGGSAGTRCLQAPVKSNHKCTLECQLQDSLPV